MKCLERITGVFLLVAVVTYANQSGDYTYTLSGSYATITQYTGPGGTVVVPSILSGYPVAKIGSYAFNGPNALDITGVILPSSLTSM